MQEIFKIIEGQLTEQELKTYKEKYENTGYREDTIAKYIKSILCNVDISKYGFYSKYIRDEADFNDIMSYKINNEQNFILNDQFVKILVKIEYEWSGGYEHAGILSVKNFKKELLKFLKRFKGTTNNFDEYDYIEVLLEPINLELTLHNKLKKHFKNLKLNKTIINAWETCEETYKDVCYCEQDLYVVNKEKKYQYIHKVRKEDLINVLLSKCEYKLEDVESIIVGDKDSIPKISVIIENL